MAPHSFRAALAAALLLSSIVPAAAQTYESVGTRAQGMAGAFVAVADDATAVWWNPAGLSVGAYFNAIVEKGRTTEPSEPSSLAVPAHRTGVGGFAVGFPALGLSYYNVRVSRLVPDSPTAAEPGNRQEGGATATGVRTLALSQFGITVDQSVGNNIVFGTTTKLIHAGAASGVGLGTAEDALDRADDLDVDGENEFDIDVGVLVKAGHARFGFSMRNMTEPDFGSEGNEVALDRQARAGLAFVGTGGFIEAFTLSGDIDVTRNTTASGDARRLAGGAEGWMLRRHLGLRGGVSMNTIGDANHAWSFGGSIAPLKGLYIDGAWTKGGDELSGWSASLRFMY